MSDPRTALSNSVCRSRESLAAARVEQIGDLLAYSIEPGNLIQLKIRNRSDKQLHVYMIEIDQDGRVTPIRLWRDSELLWEGLPPITLHETLISRDGGQIGISEWRFLASTERIDPLLSPLSIGGRAADSPSELPNDVRVKTIRHLARGKLGSW